MKKLTLFLMTIFLYCNTIIAFANQQPSPQLQKWITQQMQQYNIAGVSIVVIKDYKIAWAKGFGLADKANNRLVTTNTLFQAASISKPITAVAAMETFNTKHLALDADINTILTSWHIPPNPYTIKQPVTMRLLLSHSAGITSFREKGYTTQEKIPTLLEILNGEPPANTPPIIVINTPGTKYKYSPASYTIIQQTLVDIDQQPFAVIMKKLILNPLDMQHSTFAQPLPKKYLSSIALPYLPNGKLMPNSPLIFPTAAAGGLWTTPSDLAKFVIAIQKALAGKSQGEITPQLVKQVMEPGTNHNMGLGFEVNINKYGEVIKNSGDYFRHGGFNSGYLSMMVGSKQHGNGIVIMVNSAPYMDDPKVTQYEFLQNVIKYIAEIERWK
jgi:CubicO group peptidase (beta-lactamase class C family)